ncbi:hypothetical protein HK098_005760 [Nowakowskiella sp. JEL0407]|nr:hypothetical protein HK098_005760 [Nowakowskiella sp. JEL0407]
MKFKSPCSRGINFELFVLFVAFCCVSGPAVKINAQTVSQNSNLGSWSLLPVQQLVTCIHSFLLPGPGVPGSSPKLVCVERPHGGGAGKYPANPNTEPVEVWSNAAEISLFGASPDPKISKSTSNPFCGGHAQMADGSIFMSGGDKEAYTDPLTNMALLTDGTNINRIYTPMDVNGTVDPWKVTNAMAKGRWYPAVHTLDNGYQIIVGGVAAALNLDDWYAKKNTLNPTYEYYPSKGAAENLPLLIESDPWNLYPFVQQMPKSGKIWIFSGGSSILLDPATGATSPVAPMKDQLHHPRIYPFTSTAVMLPLRAKYNYEATIMICGGTLRKPGETSTNITSTGTGSPHCSKISPDVPNAAWLENFISFPGEGKVMPDSVLMPDGKVLFTNGAVWGTAGGDAGVHTNAHEPSFANYIFDPETSTFSKAPNATIARLYHSGALLLPDGRIITTGNEEANYIDFERGKVLAGDCFPFNGPLNNRTYENNLPTANCTDPFEYRIELYTPYYYTIPNKPVINSAYGTASPKTLTYGSNFALIFDTPATDVAAINLIRYSTTTHSTNYDQRFIELKIQYANKTHLIVEGPANGKIAPPGNWMIFPVAKNGAVGYSATVRVGKGNVVTFAYPTTTPSPTPNSSQSRYALSLKSFTLLFALLLFIF